MSGSIRLIRERVGPPSPQKVRGSDTGRYQSYRGYLLTKQRGGMWKAVFNFAPLFPQLPRSFTWTPANDIAGVRSYIDAWYSGLSDRTTALERSGSVADAVYGGSTERIETLRVNIRQFVEALKMAKSFVIPAWTKLEFVTEGRRLIPADFVACLKDLAPEAFAEHPAEGWRRALDRDLPDIRAQAQDDAEPAAVAESAAPVADEPPREETVERYTNGDALHLTTRTTRPGVAPYHTKRIIARGRVIYAATAWLPEGPWKVWTRNTSALLARDISL